MATSRTLEILWQIGCHAAAVVVAAWSLAAIPVALIVALGLVSTAFGIVLVLILPFGADPPLMGLFVGVCVTIGALVSTVVLLTTILVVTHLVSGGVVLPAMLLLRLAFDRWRVRSRFAAALVYLAVGTCAGLGAALLIGAAARWAGVRADQPPWFAAGAYSTCAACGALAFIAYAGVLRALEMTRSGLLHLARAG